MWNSKVKFTFLSFMILTLMTGCLKPGQKSAEDLEKSGNEASSFQVSNLYPEDGPQIKMTDWNLPKRKELILTACLIDKVTQDRILNQKFRIETENEIFHRTSDKEGCVKWNEPIPFKFFGAERYLKFERKIIGEGIKPGTYTVEFAYDPWLSTRGGEHAEFVWLNQPDLIDAHWMIQGLEKVRSAQTAEFAHDLLVDGLQIQIMQDEFKKEGIGLTMDVQMNPYVRLQQLTGGIKEYIFDEGRFDISVNIIGTKMGDSQNINVNMLDIGILDAEDIKMRDCGFAAVRKRSIHVQPPSPPKFDPAKSYSAGSSI